MMIFSFGLEDVTLKLSQAKSNTLWIPVIPAKNLEAYKGRKVNITEKYLMAAASETKRYYADLESRGSTYRRPILCAHDDSGRRSGTLEDFAVRDYKAASAREEDKAVPTLFVKAKFLDRAFAAVISGALAYGSVSIQPKYTDPESGNTYSPFIDEWSEANKPVIKGFSVAELHESASQLAALNLTLSEDNMTEEQMQAFLDDVEKVIDKVVDTKLAPVIERLDAIDGGEETEEETEEESEGVGNGDAADTQVAASETPVVDFAAFSKRFAALENKIDRMGKARAKGPQKSAPGVPLAFGEAKKKKAPVTLEEIKKSSGLYGIAAVIAHQEANNE